MCDTIAEKRISSNKKKVKKTRISVRESLTAKHMDMLNNAKEQFGFRNVWTLDRTIYYLLYFGGDYHRRQFLTSTLIILFLYNGIAPLKFSFDLKFTKI